MEEGMKERVHIASHTDIFVCPWYQLMLKFSVTLL